VSNELCACGEPLHYRNPRFQALIESLVAQLGPDIRVTLPGGRSWMVPRHYIALHGVGNGELAYLAAKYGWEEVE
jgi:hypothetical protein